MEAEEGRVIHAQKLSGIVMVVVDNKKAERPTEPSKACYQERVKELDLEDLACMQELATLGFKNVSHEDFH